MAFFKYHRVRWELGFIYFFAFLLSFSLEFLIFSNPDAGAFPFIKIHFLFAIFISFLMSHVWEVMYWLASFSSALLLRLGQIWKYAVPSLVVFFWILLPFSTLPSIFAAGGVLQSDGIGLILFVSLVSFTTVMFIPVFHGLNGGFIVFANAIAYGILYALISFIDKELTLAEYLFIHLYLAIMFFLFLQVRRRLGLQVYYGLYRYPGWFLFLVFFATAGVIFFQSQKRDIFYNLYFLILIPLHFLFLFFAIILHVEYKKNRRVSVIPFGAVNLFIMLLAAILLTKKDSATYRENVDSLLHNTNNLSSGYFFHLLHFLWDSDKDGENKLYDPDDTAHSRRSEGSYLPVSFGDLESLSLEGSVSGYLLWTFYSNENSNIKNYDFYFSPSQKVDQVLFSVIYGLSSYEIFASRIDDTGKVTNESIFTVLSKKRYRTICIGYDGDRNYFHTRNRYRIDQGCEVFLRYEPESAKSNVEDFLKDFVNFAGESFRSYKGQKNAIWLHVDLTSFNAKLDVADTGFLKKLINEKPELLYTFTIKNPVQIFLYFFEKPFPHFFVDAEPKLSYVPILVTNYDLAYFRVLPRALIFFDLYYSPGYFPKDFFSHPFFQKEIQLSKKRTLQHYVLVEPDDFYWKEMKKVRLVDAISLPPVSFIKEKEKIRRYDGRTGLVKVF